uniref:t-SNARE coiled-coil homology domain-containing protein n=1 Tax=Leersia perrieri TaxID=77586 RepID=A0A0D9XCV8_9ORYZ
MSMIDVLIRVDAICKKYDKYDADKHRNDAAAAGDPFSRLYAAVDHEIDAAIEKSERAAREGNRAAAVALNTDVRRTKARLLEEVVKLRKLAAKKVKGLSPEEAELRGDLVSALPHRIKSIPDGGGGGGAADWNGGGNVRPGMKFDSSGLEFISEDLDTLKNLAEDMNEELDRQVPLMDEIDNKVDKANADFRKTNVRLKETFRSTRNFIIDIILICVILGIAAYLYE